MIGGQPGGCASVAFAGRAAEKGDLRQVSPRPL